jgi:UDP-N-acetylglucosamine acyltransferase
MIHSTAVIHSKAQLGTGVEIGPYCVVGENVRLGDRCQLMSHVVVDGLTTIGSENRFFPFACIGLPTQDLKYRGGTCCVEIGNQNTFREYATLHAPTFDGGKTVVGCNGNFLAYTHIAHDCRVGDHVIISNVGTLAGHVVVEDRAVIGGLAAVHQFVRIGKMAMIGGCSKVVQDIAPFMIADGHPAEVRTINKEGLKRNGVAEEAQACLRMAFKILFRSGLNLGAALARIGTEIPNCAEVRYLVEFVQNSERGISK